MTELPLVVVDVQRGGPSTGLPTKTEQSDLFQSSLWKKWRKSICSFTCSTPINCFDWSYMASKLH